MKPTRLVLASMLVPSRYYKSMTAVETRFPISNEKDNVRISFPWTDAFRPSKKTSQYNVHFEKAAVLFNVAAVMSQQALQVERGTAEGATQACKIFQVRHSCLHPPPHPTPTSPIPAEQEQATVIIDTCPMHC